MRQAHKKVPRGLKTNSNLSQDRIERLEEIGVQWNQTNIEMLHACASTNYECVMVHYNVCFISPRVHLLAPWAKFVNIEQIRKCKRIDQGAIMSHRV